MATSEVIYLGNLRTQCKHLNSGEIIYTDAPTDNKGKGEKFSPTDLLATSYVACMMTIIGIYCQENNVKFDTAKALVTKVMEANPRRVGKIVVEMDFTGNDWDEVQFEKVVRAGKACPVAKSVHENMEIVFDFKY